MFHCEILYIEGWVGRDVTPLVIDTSRGAPLSLGFQQKHLLSL